MGERKMRAITPFWSGPRMSMRVLLLGGLGRGEIDKGMGTRE